jgi:hypothetical protein
MCLQVLLFSLKLSELFVALGDNIAVLAYLHAHLFSHVALLGFVKLFLQVSHALVFYIELSLELGQLLFDLGIACLVDFPRLNQLLHFFTEVFDFSFQFLVLTAEVAAYAFVLFGL